MCKLNSKLIISNKVRVGYDPAATFHLIWYVLCHNFNMLTERDSIYLCVYETSYPFVGFWKCFRNYCLCSQQYWSEKGWTSHCCHWFPYFQVKVFIQCHKNYPMGEGFTIQDPKEFRILTNDINPTIMEEEVVTGARKISNWSNLFWGELLQWRGLWPPHFRQRDQIQHYQGTLLTAQVSYYQVLTQT